MLLGSSVAPPRVSAQDPSRIPSGSGGWASRFVSVDVLLRMRERLTQIEPILVAAPVDSVWRALEPALEGVGVSVGFSDSTGRQIGAPQTKIFRRLGKAPLSTYLRCGDGITGPNADTYAVYFSLVSFLRPGASPGVTKLYTLVSARAEDVANGRNELIDCTSSGVLEDRIGKAVTKRLGRD